MRVSNCLTALTLLAVCAGPVRGEEGESTVPDRAAMEAAVKEIAATNDVIFNQYVDLSELDYAWTFLDAEALADIGISLAEAERILQRSHDAVESKDVLKVAIRAAAVTGVEAAMEKLKAFAEKSDNGELAQQIKMASQLMGKSRSIAPTLSLDDVSLGAFIACKQSQHDLNAALITNDIEMLGDLQSRVGEFAEKEPAIWKKLSEQINEQVKAMKALGAPSRGGPGDVSGATESLDKISGVSRYRVPFPGNNRNPGWNPWVRNDGTPKKPQETAVINGVTGALNPGYGGYGDWRNPYRNPNPNPSPWPQPPINTIPPNNPPNNPWGSPWNRPWGGGWNN